MGPGDRDEPEDDHGNVIPLRQRIRRRSEDHWHIDRGVPITWIVALVLAAAAQAAMFWVSMHDLKGEVATLGPRMERIEAAMYRQTDASQAWQAQRDRDEDRNRRITALEARMDAALSGGVHVQEHIREVPQ
jgi:hypothetical protein